MVQNAVFANTTNKLAVVAATNLSMHQVNNCANHFMVINYFNGNKVLDANI